jgi:uncharacterized protein YqgV (UPF0045/DUF77 family)
MSGISAQVSIYPLRQEHLGPAIDAAVRLFREHGLEVWEGAMSTVIAGETDTVFDALRLAFRRVAEDGATVMVVTVSNGCPVPTAADQATSTAP